MPGNSTTLAPRVYLTLPYLRSADRTTDSSRLSPSDSRFGVGSTGRWRPSIYCMSEAATATVGAARSSSHPFRIASCCARAARSVGESASLTSGLGSAPRSLWWDPSGMLMATSVDETFCVTDCADHGSRRPFVKMTCDVASARCAAPRAMPIERGIHAGRGAAWNSRRQPALSASTDHVCGGNMSLTLLAAIGCTISVHAR
mmetsp:Transcript_4027/g.12890  ORF Transcript_4027/g.12890 Transcript_4027/m.12890 type:complete len:202 (+) Transcript_4027:29-634(+)